MSANIHLRNVDNQLMWQLKQEASKNEISVNTLILSLLKRSLGLATERRLPIYHDLDSYAGTWSKERAQTFLKTLTDFEQIDKDLWK